MVLAMALHHLVDEVGGKPLRASLGAASAAKAGIAHILKFFRKGEQAARRLREINGGRIGKGETGHRASRHNPFRVGDQADRLEQRTGRNAERHLIVSGIGDTVPCHCDKGGGLPEPLVNRPLQKKQRTGADHQRAIALHPPPGVALSRIRAADPVNLDPHDRGWDAGIQIKQVAVNFNGRF